MKHRYEVHYLGHKGKSLSIAHEGEFVTAMSKATHLGQCQVRDRVTGKVWDKEHGWHDPEPTPMAVDPLKVKLRDLAGFDFADFKRTVRDIARGHYANEGEPSKAVQQ